MYQNLAAYRHRGRDLIFKSSKTPKWHRHQAAWLVPAALRVARAAMAHNRLTAWQMAIPARSLRRS